VVGRRLRERKGANPALKSPFQAMTTRLCSGRGSGRSFDQVFELFNELEIEGVPEEGFRRDGVICVLLRYSTQIVARSREGVASGAGVGAMGVAVPARDQFAHTEAFFAHALSTYFVLKSFAVSASAPVCPAL